MSVASNKKINPTTHPNKLFHCDRIDSVKDFVGKNYFVVAKNVQDLTVAEIICLGETHDSKQHRKNNGLLINTLAVPGDVLLTEYGNEMKERSIQSIEKLFEIGPKTIHRKDAEKLAAILCYERQANGIDPSLQQRLIRRGWDYEDEKVTAARKVSPTFDSRESRKLLWESLPARNRHLCKIIEANRQPGRKIFVIAGRAHLCPSFVTFGNKFVRWLAEWIGGANMRFQDIAYQETYDYLKTKRFAILIPKR